MRGTATVSYQYRLRPTKAQARALDHQLYLAAKLYNTALEQRKLLWKGRRKFVSYCEQAAELKVLRREFPEYGALNHTALQNVLRRLDRAFARFLEGVRRSEGVGYPRFKKKDRFRTLEFTYGDGVKLLPDGRGGWTLRLQAVGWVRLVWHRDLPPGAKIKRVWVTKKADGWYATFALEAPEESVRRPLPPTGKRVGVDVGLENLLALSDGTLLDNPRWLKKAERRLAEKQRILSKKVKGSKRWRKLKRQIARLHQKVARKRRDFYLKLAWDLAREYDLIAVEELNLTGLAQGMLAKPIHDAGWGAFLRETLPYIAWKAGRKVVFVDPKGTSQTCASCGASVPKPLSERLHVCPSCGHTAHRDVNAAQVILHRARSGPAGALAGAPPALCPQEAGGFSRQ
ncbi:RNA-guided endonuclease InsQ/TnpB family protein [Thermus sp.]|uniref:RNA-guided endonuclease InsQ/TnpB family protein n=1 Tax=Thermus sp. TaxID=275 RepID=UPI003D0DFFC3